MEYNKDIVEIESENTIDYNQEMGKIKNESTVSYNNEVDEIKIEEPDLSDFDIKIEDAVLKEENDVDLVYTTEKFSASSSDCKYYFIYNFYIVY